MGWTGLYTDRPTKDILTEELTFSRMESSKRKPAKKSRPPFDFRQFCSMVVV